jgi:hypothetical protein
MATSVTGFVQQLACNLLPHGYWFYVAGRIPPHKDPAAVDAKLIARYELGLSKRERARRKQLGYANLHYLRYDRRFVIVGTQGRHQFRDEERVMLRDIRRVPLKFYGYSIGYRPGGRTRSGERDTRWHTHVQIERERYQQERAYLLARIIHDVEQSGGWCEGRVGGAEAPPPQCGSDWRTGADSDDRN